MLKGEATRPAALRGGTIDVPVAGLSVVLLLLACVYGACMGSYAIVARWNTPTRQDGYLQIAYSAAKVPMLFFLTLLVTFPSLYVFNALVGSRLRLTAVLRLLVAALGVTLAVLASFGTIVLFFSLCSTSYSFMVLLNVALFAVAGLLGMRFLLQTLHRMSVAQAVLAAEAAGEAAVAAGAAHQPGAAGTAGAPLPPYPWAPDGAPVPVPPPLSPPPIPGALDRFYGQAPGSNVKIVFRVWVLVFGLVGAQMSWVLRPFIGNPTTRTTFFREREGNFFEAVLDKAVDLVTGPSSPHRSRSGRGWGNTTGGAGSTGNATASPAPSPPTAPATAPATSASEYGR